MKIIWLADGSRPHEEGFTSRMKVGVEALTCGQQSGDQLSASSEVLFDGLPPCCRIVGKEPAELPYILNSRPTVISLALY